MKKNILRIILIILIIAWMCMVFGFSNAGGNESTGISITIARFLVKNEVYIEFAEKIIRKIAHLSEYAIGAVLVYSLMLTFKLDIKVQFLSSLFFIIVYAITDEVHQLFIPGRSGNILDVWIDSLGALIGLCGLLFVMKLFRLIKCRVN